TVSNFHTDARLFNPSFDKDIQISATFYSTAGGNPLTATVTVPKRQMKILDDVTTQLFSTSSLGAILFTSADPFEATSRIYALTGAGTLGQFGPGTPPTLTKNKGAVLQLKQNGVNTQTGTFRTNIGLVNPNNATANVTWTLYDRNNAVAATKTTGYGPFAVLGPSLVTSVAGATTGDFSDAWLSFSSDQPILVYASCIDNGTTDQTFIPAVDDAGVPLSPPPPTTKNFDVTMRSFQITISPDPSTLKVGDRATFRIRIVEGEHSFELVGPDGSIMILPTAPSPGSIDERTFTVSRGTYTYFCTNSLCGVGHSEMVGSFDVEVGTPPPPRY
ncbi:MAG TPA: hypothetical protein VGK31_09055, partial [Thermoanaerobaculia bacterium]